MRIIGGIIAALLAAHLIGAAHHMAHHAGWHHAAAAPRAERTVAMVFGSWPAQY